MSKIHFYLRLDFVEKISSLTRHGHVGIPTHFASANCGLFSRNSTLGSAFLCAAGCSPRSHFIFFGCSCRIGGILFLAGKLVSMVAAGWPRILLSARFSVNDLRARVITLQGRRGFCCGL
jgi:hypothetical protein